MAYHPVSFSEGTAPHHRILTLTGISGSGKDYLLSQIIQSQIVSHNVKVLNFGEELFKHLSVVHTNIKTRDDIRELLSQSEVSEAVSNLIAVFIKEQPLVLNTHVAYIQNGQLLFDLEKEREINSKGYIFVWSDPKDILLWRSAEIHRSRPKNTIDEIADFQERIHHIVSEIARDLGSSMLTLKNNRKNVQKNTGIILESIDSIV